MFYRFVGGSWLVVGTGFVGEEGVSAPRELLLELDLRGWPKEVRREKFTPAGPTVARVVPSRSLRCQVISSGLPTGWEAIGMPPLGWDSMM